MILAIVLVMGAGAAGAIEYAPGTLVFNIGTGLNFSTPKLEVIVSGGSSPVTSGESVYAPGGLVSLEWFKGRMSYGVETGFLYAGYDFFGDTFSVMAIPVMFRFGWHPKFIKAKNLDVYLLGKVGITIGSIGGNLGDLCDTSPWGISGGGSIGAKYFFTQTIGLFLEGGFNAYRVNAQITEPGIEYTLSTNIDNYVTLGVSIKTK